ncbi:MAG: hypothetical protein MZV64_17100 [Ignavibacteriales bacterium]|nr:hypothetical protein [Ignavibacteriales bacterium]
MPGGTKNRASSPQTSLNSPQGLNSMPDTGVRCWLRPSHGRSGWSC